MQDFLQEKWFQEFQDRKTELINSNVWSGNKIPIVFEYGNTWRGIKVPKVGRQGHDLDNEWTMYVNTVADRFLIKDLVAGVLFKLHPTYKTPNIWVKEFPFTLKRTAWGYFDIDVVVNWHKELEMADTTWTHELVFFKQSGGKAKASIYFDRKLLGDIKDAGGILKYKKAKKDGLPEVKKTLKKNNSTFKRWR
jgi:transcription initiation factor IIF auxiliary subunit